MKVFITTNRAIQIETIMRYYYIFIRIDYTNLMAISVTGENAEQFQFSYIAGGNEK